MNPLAGLGYKAIMPSEEDPSKTDNLIGEIGMKYLLGQSGRLLPYEEFSKSDQKAQRRIQKLQDYMNDRRKTTIL